MFRDHKDTFRPPIQNDSDSCDEIYSCKICGKTFMTEVDLEYHRKCVHGPYLLEMLVDPDKHMCWICYRRQKNKQTLSDHVRIHHFYSSPNGRTIEHDIYICDYCNHIFYNKINLGSHIINYHTSMDEKIQFMSCPKCPKAIRPKRYWFHSIAHGLSFFTTCQICAEVFKNKKQLLKHIWEVHPNILRCDVCQYETKSREQYEKHFNEHGKRNPVRCKNYNDYFLGPRLPVRFIVDRWFRGIPLPQDFYICILCRVICSNTDEKRRHIEIYHGEYVPKNRRVHMCHCGEEFFNAILLKQHLLKMKTDPVGHRVLSNDEINQRASDEKPNVYDTSDPLDIDNEDMNLLMRIEES